MSRPARGALIALAALLALMALPVAASAQRPILDIGVFARVPAPGQPEGLAVSPTTGWVWTSSYNNGKGDPTAPARVFAYDQTGLERTSFAVEGEDTSTAQQGAGGIAFDAEGLMYVIDTHPARIVTVDPGTGEQHTYAEFRTVGQCPGDAPDGDCTLGDRALGPLPGAMVFLPDGAMLVTDLQQALIWRVPRGGGTPTVWFTDGRLASDFGLNKVVWAPDHRTLILSDSLSATPGLITSGAGAILRLPIEPDGSPGQISEIWESAVGEAPDGVAVAESGDLYVSTSNGNQMLKLSPGGTVLARAPSPEENARRQVQLDGPSSVVFLGRRLIVANQSFLTGNSANWALLDVWAGEDGVPLFYPAFRHGGAAALCPRRVARIRLRRRRPMDVRVLVRGRPVHAWHTATGLSFWLPASSQRRVRATVRIRGSGGYRHVLRRTFSTCPRHLSREAP